jgi:hypothetical protein
VIRYLFHIILELIWWDYQLVGTFETKIKHRKSSYSTEEFSVFIHCFESRWGTRYSRVRVQKKPTFFGYTKHHLKRKIRRAELYQTEIYPWLNGRWNDKIPSFKKVEGGTWDFLKRLKGETSVVLNDDEK